MKRNVNILSHLIPLLDNEIAQIRVIVHNILLLWRERYMHNVRNRPDDHDPTRGILDHVVIYMLTPDLSMTYLTCDNMVNLPNNTNVWRHNLK